MNRFLPTVYKQLSTDEIMTSKGTREDYDRFWNELLPAQMDKLERLWEGPAKDLLCSSTSGRVLPGELYLWSMLYQLSLVDKDKCWPEAAAWMPSSSEPVVLALRSLAELSKRKHHLELHRWYQEIADHELTKAVVEGKSSMGELGQYYQHADSTEVCREADERGRWG